MGRMGSPEHARDGTELRIAPLGFPKAACPSSLLRGCRGRHPDVHLPGSSARWLVRAYVSDESGWGHIYRRDLASGGPQLTSGEFEYSTPAWAQGMRTFTETKSGTVVGLRQEAGFITLVAITPGGELRELSSEGSEYSYFSHPVAAPNNEKVAVIASGGTQPQRVVVFDLAETAATPSVRRRADSEAVRKSALSKPEPVSWKSFDGEQAHGTYWPPASEEFEGTGSPPLIVLPHGGPTSQVYGTWHPQAQYFATRGYAVLCPNYRGSTGYGREYMLKLRESWGIYDVQERSSSRELANAGAR